MQTELRVLLLAQTPPPHHGQALMLERLARATFSRIRVFHVRMAFSTTSHSIGRFEFRKLAHLVAVIARAIYVRFRHGTSMLVFPPAGPNRNPVLRDILLLIALRPLFEHVVFTFHAAGVSEFLESCPRNQRALARRAYASPDGAIVLSSLLPPDAQRFHAGRIAVIPNGIPDVATDTPIRREGRRAARVLYVGLLTESKGVLVLLDAARLLLESGATFELVFLGDFGSHEFEARARARCQANGVSDTVRFLGPIHGPARWEEFRAADVLCLPTYYESEALPLVIIEAMMYALPVIATRWRGIPDLVDDGRSGFLVPPGNSVELAGVMQRLLGDPALRKQMGHRARQRFVEEFTLDKHLRKTEEFLLAVAGEHRSA
jgi:glycosyltransferase involved in cell wall biosynthesis